MSSSKYPERWIIPGGGVEPEETSGAETAVREVLEEAGVLGRLGRCLGVFEVNRKKIDFFLYKKVVTFFFLFSFLE